MVAHENLHFSELLLQHNAAIHVPRIQACLDKAKGTVKELHHLEHIGYIGLLSSVITKLHFSQSFGIGARSTTSVIASPV